MPSLEVFNLTFATALHVGRHGIGQEEAQPYVPADTLAAAFLATRALLAGDAGDWVEMLRNDAPFLITSAFPFAGDVRFYPRPVGPLRGLEPKQSRRIRYVSSEILERLLRGEVDEALYPRSADQTPARGITIQDGALWLTADEAARLPDKMRLRADGAKAQALPLGAIQRRQAWAEGAVPRVRVDRITQAPEIFHTGRVTFAPGCGLWVGVAWRDRSKRTALIETLRALGDAGLGAERAAGYGAFDVGEGGEAQWPDARPAGLMLLLSRFYPKPEEATRVLTAPGAAYDLTNLAGHAQTLGVADQRRQRARLVAEGSLVGGAAQGTLAEVTPKGFPHPVWRYGLAVGIGWEGKPT